MELAVVHYAYLCNNWEDILQKQLDRYSKSGLYHKSKYFYLVVTDTYVSSNAKLKEMLAPYPKILLEYYSNNNLYEYYALKRIHELSLENPNLGILYFMLKGNTNKYIKNYKTNELSKEKESSVESFVEMLEYTLIDNWEKCYEKLKEGNSMVGANRIHAQWYGNCWWVSSNYLKYNEKPSFNPDTDSRWACEFWVINKNPQHTEHLSKFYEFFPFWCDNYYTTFPKFLYDGTDRTQIKFEVLKAYYGYFPTAQHEMSPIPLDYSINYDVTEEIKNNFTLSNTGKIDLKFACDDKLPESIKGFDKRLKIYYRTNLSPKDIHIISSIPSNNDTETGKIFL